jgi:hypothetical protein
MLSPIFYKVRKDCSGIVRAVFEATHEFTRVRTLKDLITTVVSPKFFLCCMFWCHAFLAWSVSRTLDT